MPQNFPTKVVEKNALFYAPYSLSTTLETGTNRHCVIWQSDAGAYSMYAPLLFVYSDSLFPPVAVRIGTAVRVTPRAWVLRATSAPTAPPC